MYVCRYEYDIEVNDGDETQPPAAEPDGSSGEPGRGNVSS